MEKKSLAPLKLEKFTLKRWEKYEKNGVPMRLVTDRGHNCKILAFNAGEDGKQLVIEETRETSYGKSSASYYVNTNGKGYNVQIYIRTGCIDVEKGDLMIDYWSRTEEDGMFFFEWFDGFCALEKRMGYGQYWGIDSNGNQFTSCHTFHDLRLTDKEPCFHNVRKATEEEEELYWQLLLKAGYEEDEQGIHEVPKVGVEYWSVEMEKGKAVVVHHDAPQTEEERPFGHLLCSTYEKRAIDDAERINRHSRR